MHNSRQNTLARAPVAEGPPSSGWLAVISRNIPIWPGTVVLLALCSLRRAGTLSDYGIAVRSSTQAGAFSPSITAPSILCWSASTGVIASRWGQSENHRRARLFELTASGLRRLTLERERWDEMIDGRCIVYRGKHWPAGRGASSWADQILGRCE